MLKARNQFIFTLSILAIFSMSAHAATCENAVKPVKTAQPDYPRRAHARRIEGYVKFSFTISAEGDVKDVVVTESEPKGVFDRTAVRTIGRFKFTPCMVDGAPIEVTDVEQTFSFSLGK